VPNPPIAVVAEASLDDVSRGMDAVRDELEVPDGFPDEVTAAAAEAAAVGLVGGVRGHAGGDLVTGHADRTGVELVTIDPPGSRDYAHVTAPLRRLCDRAANEIVLALIDGRDVPDWAAAEAATLPEVMAEATRREGAYSRAALDLVEALVLRPAVGHRFGAVVVDRDDDRAQVQLREPAVVARARHDGGCVPGDEVDVVVRAADPVARRLDLEVVG
jgi:exoribonuclease R